MLNVDAECHGDRVSIEARRAEWKPTPELAAAKSAAALCPFNAGRTAGAQDATQRTMVLTGASRGIGHATVKLFSEAGGRGGTC
jgi:NADPH:quinone reductase-like Zn-dependent oxidoreductase